MKADECTWPPSPVSVIIPTYNRAALIPRALHSVLPQCMQGDEVIVVDDGSTDETEAVLERYSDQIRYLRVPHGGAGKARNIGIQATQNPLIGFLDSDDEWMPGKLALQRTVLQMRPDVLFCFSDLAYRYASGREEHKAFTRGYRENEYTEPSVQDALGPGVPFSSIAALPEGHGDFLVHVGDLYPRQMERAFVQVNTLLYRRGKETAESVSFPEDLRTREDWEFVGRLARNGLAAYLDCETTWYYKHDGPQLMKLDYVVYLEDRLKLLARLWGRDSEFLNTYGEKYQKIYNSLYWRLMREWLCLGKIKEVQNELAGARNVPWQFRILSRQPRAVSRLAFGLRDILRGEF